MGKSRLTLRNETKNLRIFLFPIVIGEIDNSRVCKFHDRNSILVGECKEIAEIRWNEAKERIRYYVTINMLLFNENFEVVGKGEFKLEEAKNVLKDVFKVRNCEPFIGLTNRETLSRTEYVKNWERRRERSDWYFLREYSQSDEGISCLQIKVKMWNSGQREHLRYSLSSLIPSEVSILHEWEKDGKRIAKWNPEEQKSFVIHFKSHSVLGRNKNLKYTISDGAA